MDIGPEFVMGLSASLRENAGRMVDGAISLAKNLAQGLADSIPTIVQHVPTIISNIAGIINDNSCEIHARHAPDRIIRPRRSLRQYIGRAGCKNRQYDYKSSHFGLFVISDKITVL